jgi:hypothetical protein
VVVVAAVGLAVVVVVVVAVGLAVVVVVVVVVVVAVGLAVVAVVVVVVVVVAAAVAVAVAVKLKSTLQQAMKAQRGSRGTALHFLQPQRYMGWVVKATAALLPGKARYPLYRRLGRPQGRSGRVWV